MKQVSRSIVPKSEDRVLVMASEGYRNGAEIRHGSTQTRMRIFKVLFLLCLLRDSRGWRIARYLFAQNGKIMLDSVSDMRVVLSPRIIEAKKDIHDEQSIRYDRTSTAKRQPCLTREWQGIKKNDLSYSFPSWDFRRINTQRDSDLEHKWHDKFRKTREDMKDTQQHTEFSCRWGCVPTIG